MFETTSNTALVLGFDDFDFEIVSGFDIRISDS
jgi:hypothetical protein